MTTVQFADDLIPLQRKQEIIFDLSFDLGARWANIDARTCGVVMDYVNGSRGLYEAVTEWADEFDAQWEARPEDERENYIGEITPFVYAKLDALIAAATAA